jgi:ABC-type transport system involved in cytochrome c biogenesis permease subunit
MSRLNWLALGGALMLVAALVAAFVLYLRTAYRKGGWRRVRTDLMIAIVALVALYIIRTADNSQLEMLKEAVNHLTK